MSASAGDAALPRYTTSFIGRDRERHVLKSLVDANRFVAVVGPGGVGKTRLASVIAGELAAQFDAGTVLTDLGAATTAGELCVAIAAAVGMRDSNSVSPAALMDYLNERRTLVVLDGCELLDSDGLLLIQDLIGATSHLRLLATSRRALHVDGGQSMSLAPLAAPPPPRAFGTGTTQGEIASQAAVQLFVDRARRVRSDFTLTDANSGSVAALCHRLDGLPLALELAASWVRALSVDQILERMDETRDFPRAGTPNVAPRHRTLRSLVAGTYSLCSAEERLLWSRMTVFEGGFDLSAAEAICGDAPLDIVDLLEFIASLVDQSVVVVDEVAGRSRYRLLRISRDYAVGMLGDADRQVLARRHMTHYQQVLQTFIDELPGPDQFRLIDQLGLDYPNVLAAIGFALSDPVSVRTSLRMASDLWAFWFCTGRLTEGRSLLRTVLASPSTDAHTAERATALYANAYLCVLQGEMRTAEKSLEIAAATLGRPDGPLIQGMGLQMSAMVDMGQHRIDRAPAWLEEAIDLYAGIDDPRARLLFLDATGLAVALAALSRDSERVRTLGPRGLAACAEFGDVLFRGYIEYGLAIDQCLQGRVNEAGAAAAQVLRTSRDELLMTHCVELLAWCAERQGRHETAALLFGSAGRSWRQLGGDFSGFRAIADLHEQLVKEATSAIGDEAFRATYELGESLSYADVVAQISEVESPPDRVQPELVPLTAREMQVAQLVAEGRTNREIAQALTISLRTAESHVDHILTKLGLPNRTHVATWMLGRPSARSR